MKQQPILKTKRLILRPFDESNIPEVTRLAGDFAIADTTICIPHPYSENDARTWIGTHAGQYESGKSVTYAITAVDSGRLIGSISLSLNTADCNAELGYWIGKPFWGNGFATEASARMIQYGFEELNLNRIHAHYMVRNPASGKVMRKIGMKFEGQLRQHVKKNDNFEDIDVYAILRSEYEDSLVK